MNYKMKRAILISLFSICPRSVKNSSKIGEIY
nr:MAG TPA: hypothetical protein [Caudoviricetes sp.]